MKTRFLGAQRLAVSEIGFGCMGLNHNRGPALCQYEADQLLREAVDAGITFFDTAEHYGPEANEVMVGHALHPVREQVVLATKFGVFDKDGKRFTDSSPQNIRASVEASLRRLNTDHIDLYYQHFVDPVTPPEVVADTIAQLVQEGKILHWGLVKPDAAYAARAHAAFPLTAVAAEYSMLVRTLEQTLFPFLKEHGIGFVALSPMAKGFFSGTLGLAPVFAPGDTRGKSAYLKPEALQKNQPLLDVLARHAAAHQTTTTAVALAWLLAQGEWLVPIPGCKSATHLHEIVSAESLSLHPSELEALNAALQP